MCQRKRESSDESCHFFLILGSGFAVAQDLRHPPSSAEIDCLIAKGMPAVKSSLGVALAAGYQPGRTGVSGSSGNPAYTSWLMLWRWSDLLSRTGETETARLLQRHLFIDLQTGKLAFVGPGDDTDFKDISEAQASEIAKNPPEDVLKKLLPNGTPSALEPLFSGIVPPKKLLQDGTLLPHGSLSGILTPELVAEFMKDDGFSRAFFAIVSEDDYLPFVLSNLRDMRLAEPVKWKDYRQLAIALAVVNDSAPPDFWPHPQVEGALVPREQLPVSEQFSAWIAANESGKCLLDLRKLNAGQLKFVVDAFVKPEELAWARKNVRLPRVSFDKAYFMVKYRNDRLKARQYDWTGAPYTLEEIRKQGGICVDQAYFAMLSGKANGLPTLYFRGQGADGGHAWFGYMKSDDRWELDCGRYATQNYAVGQALDPQSWKPISDHELLLLAARFRDRPEFAASVNDIVMGGVIEAAGNQDLASKAYESAVRTSPMNPDAWDRQGAFLARSGASPAERKKFHEAALKQFAGNADLKVAHQMALADIARELGDSATAEKLEHLILLQNRRKRSDLSVDVVARQMQTLLDAGKLDDAGKEFRRQLTSLADTGGGNLFYNVAAPYIAALLDAGKKAEAQKAADLVRKKLAPEKGGILDVDIRALVESPAKN